MRVHVSSMEGSKCGVLNHKSQPWAMGMSSTADKAAPAVRECFFELQLLFRALPCLVERKHAAAAGRHVLTWLRSCSPARPPPHAAHGQRMNRPSFPPALTATTLWSGRS
jgi:hypothetical protein